MLATYRPSEEFHNKVNVLLAYINDVYFDGQMNLPDPDGLKSVARFEKKRPCVMSTGFDKFLTGRLKWISRAKETLILYEHEEVIGLLVLTIRLSRVNEQ